MAPTEVVCPSHYRMLVNKKDFKYITIEPKIHEVDDLCFPPILLSKLPPFPAGNWNYGRISQAAENATTFFAETSRKDFPSITPLWHAKSYDYLSFKIGQRLRANVYVASSPQFRKPIIAKFARFEWEIGYYITETQAYSWIDGSSIGPEFLGYLTEDGWVIGFLIENVDGRHATISDLPACKAVVRQLHGLGILHKDLNKHNFLISEGGAVLIDFETAERSDDSEAMEAELRGLEEQPEPTLLRWYCFHSLSITPVCSSRLGLMFSISWDIRILSVVNSASGCSALSVHSLNELFPVGSEAVHLFQCP